MEIQKTVLIKALPEGNLVQHAAKRQWRVDPDTSGQVVHLAGVEPALATLIFNSLCR